MKKTLGIILGIIMIFSTFSFIGCGGEKNGGTSDEKKFDITVNLPDDGIVPVYGKAVRDYLSAPQDERTRLAEIASAGVEGQRSYVYFSGKYCETFVARVSRTADFAKYFERELNEYAERPEYKINLKTLIPGEKYYVMIYDKNDAKARSDVYEFTAENLTTRVLTLTDENNLGTRNVRDSGGYAAGEGKRVKYEMIYRGSYLKPRADKDETALTEFGRNVLKNELKVRAEIDLRTSGGDDYNRDDAAKTPQTLNYIAAALPYYKCTITQYDLIFKSASSAKAIKEIFDVLADEKNYPVYIHCNAGADRTGTILTLLHAILGVSEKDAATDFELTSFSIMGKRLAVDLQQNNTDNYIAYGKFVKKLLSYSETGDFEEGATNYLLSIGVEKQTIEKVKSLLTEEI